jgi:hypothetical protein
MSFLNKQYILLKDIFRRPWARVVLKIIAIFLGIVLIAWLSIAAYVNSNKKELLHTITKQLNENLKGKLFIESMEPALIRGFPGISISLKNVVLRDSLWDKHHHDVVNAKEVYVAINAFSILTGSPTIKDISLQNGKIYLFTDSTGYHNTDLFRKTSNESKGGGARKKIKRIYLKSMSVIIDNQLKHSLFDFTIRKASGKINYSAHGWSAEAGLNTLVNSLAFKTAKGSFLKNKNLIANLEMEYDENTDLLTIPAQNITIGSDDFALGGKFSFDEKRSDFNLEVSASSIVYKNALSLLPERIALQLQKYDIKNPFTVHASIKGKLKKAASTINNGGNTSIKVYSVVKNNTLSVNGETIENASFNSLYTNEAVKGKGLNDENSSINFYKMTGKWSGLPFKADSVKITNLKLPVIEGRFTSDFPLTNLNTVLGGETFAFSQGTAKVNLAYKAPFAREDQTERYIFGTVKISNGSATYLPRNLPFKNVQAKLDFRGRDLFLQDVQVQSNSSTLKMNGSIKDFSNFYYTDPQKLLLDWNIASPQINLGEFLAFLGKRKTSSNTSKMSVMSKQLDKMLEQGSIHMQLKVDRLLYKKFSARNINSDITLRQAGITVKNVSLNNAGGSFQMNGSIDQSGNINQVKMNTRIVKANVQELFKSFNNFGQTTITSQNLKGSFSANTNISATIKDNGEVVPWSINGTVDFNLTNGALVNFDPLLRMGAFAFPKRDFSNITMKDVKNNLTIQGKTVNIPRMEIATSVLNIFLDGVYGFSEGTNISLQVPLRNPKKDEFIFDKEERERRSTKGIVINLHAVDGKDGKVKFKLGDGK